MRYDNDKIFEVLLRQSIIDTNNLENYEIKIILDFLKLVLGKKNVKGINGDYADGYYKYRYLVIRKNDQDNYIRCSDQSANVEKIVEAENFSFIDSNFSKDLVHYFIPNIKDNNYQYTKRLINALNKQNE